MPSRSFIHRPSPTRIWGLRAAVAAIALTAMYLSFELGRIQAGHNIVDVAAERQAFNAEIAGLENSIRELKEEVAVLETHKEIDTEAYREVEASLADLQSKIQEQRDAIAFYRGIVSPDDGARGLRVQEMTLTSGRDERVFNVRLVLVQAMRHDRRVSGDVVLQIAGEDDQGVRTYTYTELKTDAADSAWPFSFRYYQDFERELVLPDGFTPLSVSIEVRSRTRSIDSIEETYAWAVARG
ncbi:MAG: DUF6776 family protein [Pseudomonadota bacterium]